LAKVRNICSNSFIDCLLTKEECHCEQVRTLVWQSPNDIKKSHLLAQVAFLELVT